MSRGPQQRPPDEATVPPASYSRMVIPMTLWPLLEEHGRRRGAIHTARQGNDDGRRDRHGSGLI